jgi:hypothetical protein
VLVALDVLVSAKFATPSAGSAWRMPRALPTSQLDVAATALAESPGPVVAVVGGSPAWGDAVGSAKDAVPGRLQALIGESGSDARVVDFACNGQLVADSYVLARYAAQQGAGLVVVQVTYHNFNPDSRNGLRSRYPELPDLLGVPIDADAARVLKRDPTPRPDLTGATERWLRKRWALYGAREKIASRYLGASPEQLLFSKWSEVFNGFGTLETTVDGDRGPFSELDPGEQTMMANEWETQTQFAVSAKDSETRMLARLCREVSAAGTPVVVYLAPVNLLGLAESGMLDQARFDANVAAIRKVVQASGGSFVDLNKPAPLPMDAFADINHTTAEGCELTARRLFASPEFERGLPR